MSDKYILEGHTPVIVNNLLDWAKWYETADRVVCQTKITDDINVSTVFLGLDHSFGGNVPLLFETMIFGGKLDQEMERYATWEEAEEGHQKWIIKATKERG